MQNSNEKNGGIEPYKINRAILIFGFLALAVGVILITYSLSSGNQDLIHTHGENDEQAMSSSPTGEMSEDIYELENMSPMLDFEIDTWRFLYQYADFERFKTPASENGLGGTLIRISGNLIRLEETGHIINLIIQDENQNLWAAWIESIDNDFETLLNKAIIVYGEYRGVSAVLGDIPAVMMTRYEVDGIVTIGYWDSFKEAYMSFAELREAEHRVVDGNYGEILFSYREINTYTINDGNGNAYIYFDSDAFVMITKSDIDISRLSFDNAILVFDSMISGFNSSFEEIIASEITETRLNNQVAFEIYLDLIDGGTPYYGDYKTQNIIFAGVNNVYTVGFIAPIDMFDSHYEHFKEFLDSILSDPLQTRDSRQEYMSSSVTVDYNNLIRNPSNYEGMIINITVRIEQELIGSFLRESGYRGTTGGNEWYITYRLPETASRIIVGDRVTFYGEFAGLREMTRALTGVREYIPNLIAVYHE